MFYKNYGSFSVSFHWLLVSARSDWYTCPTDALCSLGMLGYGKRGRGPHHRTRLASHRIATVIRLSPEMTPELSISKQFQ